MAVDIQRFFNEDLPIKLASNPHRARQIGAKYRLNITGLGGGQWFVDVSDRGPKVIPGAGEGSDVTVTLTAEDFQEFYENPQVNGRQLFFAGKIKIDGNPALAQKLPMLFAIA